MTPLSSAWSWRRPATKNPRGETFLSQRGATEQRNPRSRRLDQLTTRELLRTINREDQTVARAVRKEIGAIAQAVTAIVQAIDGAGRLIYVGAGTSGRLATLDAAECPPTFGVPPRWCRP